MSTVLLKYLTASLALPALTASLIALKMSACAKTSCVSKTNENNTMEQIIFIDVIRVQNYAIKHYELIFIILF
jgi:hypothetical protein